ncbi:hypothetical protein MOD54_06420 [Bacillus spizizenii]|uniref:Uncharacterized protein n=2 Tax=Bacillus spizizenii TaxID=96241 RepID=A0A9Q4H8S3_BACSC|nr:hypothetical protein [Bacillus spizizenii]MCY7829313.1 hypothetical protein [Bacillus spizizenii]MCY7831266.1 hypothetical protein [Bacillus spizizenii]MCY7838946.1 hypothetical protein [Bacillus spizizenii]MCY8107868.1 hypothetical protein [Bacillus spizizenii]MCY8119655.1 hypothetical protein [Bacillus spizizenii]
MTENETKEVLLMRKHVKLDVPKANLHPLRITQGWKVNYNHFVEIDPRTLEPNDDSWFLFTDSLLQLYHEQSSITLDLGWVPDISAEGNYLVSIVKNNDWETPIKEFSSDDYKKVIAHIEYHLKEVTTTWWK